MNNIHLNLCIICIISVYVNSSDLPLIIEQRRKITINNDQDLNVLPLDRETNVAIDVPKDYNPQLNDAYVYLEANVTCWCPKSISAKYHPCSELKEMGVKISEKRQNGTLFTTYFNRTYCCCYLKQTASCNIAECDISHWFFLYTGILALVIFIAQITCIYYILKKKEVLQDQKLLLQQSIKKESNVQTFPKAYNKLRQLEEDTHEMQVPIRSNHPFQNNMRYDREPSNIYHSLDNLHIGSQDSPPPKPTQWRISRREIDVYPKSHPREPINPPYIPKPMQVSPSVSSRRPVPCPLEKPRTDTELIATELNAALNRRKIAENIVTGQKHNPSTPEKKNIQKVLPIVKTRPMPTVTRIHPPQIPEAIRPFQKPPTVAHLPPRETYKKRVPTPPSSPSHGSGSEGISTSRCYSNEDEDWNYEELSQYPIYNT